MDAMKTLVIDRSTKVTSSVLLHEDGALETFDLGIWSQQSPCCHIPPSLGRIVVGLGPGSFAGIRSALAFALGWSIGSGADVRGIVSAVAFAEADKPVAVIGDARRGKFWVALFEGYRLVTGIFQVVREDLDRRVPRGVKVVSPDDARIADVLKDVFGESYSPAPPLSAEALAHAFTANPALLVAEPRPVYLNPAVRCD